MPTRTDEHTLAYYESCDIVDLLELWEGQVDQFPGLKAKIQTACKKGTILTDSEKPSASSNKPRNDIFGFVLAGKFQAVGIPIASVDGIYPGNRTTKSTADFSFYCEQVEMNVECKRVQSQTQLLTRAKHAQKQIARTRRYGIIAIDCSVLARPAGHLLETSSPEQAAHQLSKWLESQCRTKNSEKPKV